MSSIFGFWNFNGEPLSQEYASKMMDKMNHWDADSTNIWKENTTQLGHLLLKNSHQSYYEKQPYFDVEKQLCITADATLYNRDQLMAKLGLVVDLKLPDSQLILYSYQKWGKDCPQQFNGDFAFAIWDAQNQEFFCARDHHGIKPFYYSYDSGMFAFASEIKGLLEFPTIKKKINGQWIADYLCRIWLDREHTLYQNIKRLEPATAMIINANGITQYSYWKLDQIKELKLSSESEYIEAFREELRKAVSRRVDSHYNVASELSGGLDSSTVSAIANQELKGKGLTTYSFVLPPKGEFPNLQDERDWIKIICEYTGIEKSRLLTGEGQGLFKAFDWNARVQDEPPKEMNCMFRDILYEELKEKNTRVLLSGFGGDEMVSQHVPNYLSGLMEAKQWGRLWKEVKAISKEKNRSTLRTAFGLLVKSLINRDSRRLNKLLINYFKRTAPVREKLKYRPLKDELYEEYNIYKRFEQYQDLYISTGNFIQDQVRRMQQKHVMYRLELSSIAALSYKLEYRYPLLDVSLIEFYLSLPIHLKAQNGKGRYIFRKAIEAYLPPSIVWRFSKKGSSNPQLAVREKIDGDQLVEKLRSIPANHPIHQYADFSKRKEVIPASSKGKNRVWHNTTTDFMNLLLAKKIESLNLKN
ncbi:MAG: asparagine synthase-related protein [Vicingaceae bacterium]